MSFHDLHSHSTASDGSLSPAQLVQAASAAGVGVLALTDHDSTAGLAEAGAAAQSLGVRLISAVEVSTTWNGKSVHIVGLNIDPACAELQRGLRRLQALRGERALEMGRRLDQYGIPGVYEAARELAGEGMITRTHFAHCLARAGLAADVRDVFERYLTQGKPGYVSTQWATLEDAVAWIRAAGGTAVVAHPQRYRLHGGWMRRLLAEFREAGGAGLEVVSGTGGPGDVQSSAEYARRFDLLASVGSDFHGPEQVWPKLGRLAPLPPGLKPVWQTWEANDGG